MFGSLGKAVQSTSIIFTSQLALDNGMQEKINCDKKLVAVKNCRSIGKKDMLYNDATPDIDVNPETYEVKVDGKITTTDPATKLSLGRLYHLF